MKVAYIGLGSNRGDRVASLRRALDKLSAAGARPRAVSSLYASAPVDGGGESWFLNCAAALATDLSPLRLLWELQRIERELGRRRGEPGPAPRTIDLDLLLYDFGGSRWRVNLPALRLPHPRFEQRKFVLLPLLELGALPPGAHRQLAARQVRTQFVRRLVLPGWGRDSPPLGGSLKMPRAERASPADDPSRAAATNGSVPERSGPAAPAAGDLS